MTRYLASALALALVLPASNLVAQSLPTTAPGTADPAGVRAGTYQVDPHHTQIIFKIDHLGFSPFYGVFSQASGSLKLDPKQPAASVVDISVPVSSIYTTSAKLDEELKGAQWFDAAKFPTATFKSTAVRVTSQTTADVTGNLTLHGVTKPVTLKAKFYGQGPSPMSKAATVGFEASGTISRSDFGVKSYVPLVGDKVTLKITAAFEMK